MRDHDAIGHRFYWIVLIPFACSAERSSTNTDNAVIEWNQAALQGIRDTHLGAPMMARALAILHTCMYDAWAAYDGHALGTQLRDALRRPPAEWTSRRYGGIHFERADMGGRLLGKLVAARVWTKAHCYWDAGTLPSYSAPLLPGWPRYKIRLVTSNRERGRASQNEAAHSSLSPIATVAYPPPDALAYVIFPF